MNITSKRAGAIINRYSELEDLAHTFAREKRPDGRHGEVRVSNDGVEENVNTACHCHPEYEWITVGTFQEFEEWLDKRAVAAAAI